MSFYLITWNSEGETLGGYEWRLDTVRPNVMVVQECGNLARLFPNFPPQKIRFKRILRLGQISGYECAWCLWSTQGSANQTPVFGATGNVRCSMAMFFVGDIDCKLLEIDEDRGLSRKRPVMLAKVGPCLVANVHAPSGANNATSRNAYLNEVIERVNSEARGTPWVVAGDFNEEPDDLTGHVDLQGGAIIASGSVTRPKSMKEFDYAVSDCPGIAADSDERPIVPLTTGRTRAATRVVGGAVSPVVRLGMVTRSRDAPIKLGIMADYRADHLAVVMRLDVD